MLIIISTVVRLTLESTLRWFQQILIISIKGNCRNIWGKCLENLMVRYIMILFFYGRYIRCWKLFLPDCLWKIFVGFSGEQSPVLTNVEHYPSHGRSIFPLLDALSHGCDNCQLLRLQDYLTEVVADWKVDLLGCCDLIYCCPKLPRLQLPFAEKKESKINIW